MSSARTFHPYRSLGLALCASGALLGATVSAAADRGKLSDAQAAYQADRAACQSGQTNQDRATCLREAGAALQEARRGALHDGQAEFDKNRLARCDRHPPGDAREHCVRMMNGEGTTSGSAAGGGIYRELVVKVPAGN